MEDSNPFASPADVETSYNPGSEERDWKIATSGTRFLNLLLDFIFIQCISFAVGVVFVLADAFEIIEEIPDLIFGMILWLLYYVPFEFGLGKSLAKFITGTRVINAEGGTPSFGQIVGRTFCRFIPFEAFSFLGGKGHPVGWHDSISGTRVVKDR